MKPVKERYLACDMESVKKYLRQQGKLSLQAFRSAYAFLVVTQRQRGYITHDDIRRGLLLGANLSQQEVAAHLILIHESSVSIVPALSTNGTKQMHFISFAEGEAPFIQRILSMLAMKGEITASVLEFKQDCDVHFLPTQIARAATLVTLAQPSDRGSRATRSSPHTSSSYNPAPSSVNLPKPSSLQLSPGPAPPRQERVSSAPSSDENSLGKDSFEKCAEGVILMAEIRRGGMDILFPQKKHDQVSFVNMCMMASKSVHSRG
jgi:hypothetical protein